MNISAISTITTATLLLCLASVNAKADPASEFDEDAIKAIQESQTDFPPAFRLAADAFESATDPAVKAAKWEELVTAVSEGLTAANWSPPPGGWKLLEFPASGNLTLDDVRWQAQRRASDTKLVAQNEAEAVRLRFAGSLLSRAAIDGAPWGAILLLDIAQRPDGNMKRLAYWFTRDFASDERPPPQQTEDGVPTGNPVWGVDWNAWQQAYNAANSLGKAIILRNITMLSARRGGIATAAAINVAALSGTDRELKAIALAFGDPAFGSAVTAKWAEIAGNAADPQLQALAQEVRAKFGITD